MSNFVFVLDTGKRPLDPIHSGTARHLLNAGKAAVFRRFPFTIILKEACPDVLVQDLELKLDPGFKTTGIAIKQGNKVLFGAELQHRGQQIKDALLSRCQLRRGRRNRQTRYRQARFLDRTRLNLPKAHWLDAACMGQVERLKILTSKPLLIVAKGHGTRQICGTDKFGFPSRHRSLELVHKGFQTGDSVGDTVNKYPLYLNPYLLFYRKIK